MVGGGKTGNPTWTPGKKKEPKTPRQKEVNRKRSKERLAQSKKVRPNLPESYIAMGRILAEMMGPSDSDVKKTAKQDTKENKRKTSPEDQEFAGKVKKAMGKKKVGHGIDNLKRDIKAAGQKGVAAGNKRMQEEGKTDMDRAKRANKVKATFRAALNKHKGDSQAAKKEIYAGQAKEKADKAKSAKNESYGPGHDAGMKASKGAKNNREQISSYLKARKAKEGRAKGSLADVKTGTVGTTRASKGNPKS